VFADVQLPQVMVMGVVDQARVSRAAAYQRAQSGVCQLQYV